MLLIGLLPLIAGFGLWVWAQQMYTVGISVTVERGLIVVSFVDILLICGGAYLLRKPKIKTDPLPA
jgi:hypothetical protein